jgi:hypothetical protein
LSCLFTNKIQRIRETVQADPRVRMVSLPENQGVAKALNRGFHELFSLPGIEYLTWVSSDNIYSPDFLLTLRTHLQAAPPEVGVVYSCFQEIDEAGKPLRDEAYLNDRRKYQQRRKEELLDFHFIGVSFMYKTAYARLIGGYGQEPVEDYDYFLRLTEHCEVRYIQAVLMEYRVNSPMSVSTRLKSSKDEHRQWRYMFQLVKQQARMRRGIPPEITVLFPVADGTDQTVESYENLLEQYYSNYQLVVLDQTPQKLATRVLQTISDPRVGFLHVPGGARTAMHAMLKHIQTPFVLFYANGSPMDYYALHSMAAALRSAEGQRSLSAFLPVNGSGVQLRNHPVAFEPVFHQLYRTSRLLGVWQTP